ncbi:NeuD/PglB/VioB family sugar acetyltransferase [Chloroflexota bacterium]
MEEIIIPMLNANEPEARIVEIHVKELQKVQVGEIILTIETTKATADITATFPGYIQLTINKDDIVSVGRVVGWIKKNKHDAIPLIEENKSAKNEGDLRITQPARRLAEQLKINLNSIPSDQLITSAHIKKIAAEKLNISIPKVKDPQNSIVIYGGGGHAKTVIELIKSTGKYEIIGIIDDNIPVGKKVLGVPILGTRLILNDLRKAGVKKAANSVGGVLDINIRTKITKILKEEKFSLPNLLHSTAMIEKSVNLGSGLQVFAGAYIGSDVVLGNFSMVNTNAVVSHDCSIGAHSHISPGCLLAGEVQIGNSCLIGMGVTTAIGIRIGNRSRIGNGAIIYADVPENSIIKGGKIWTGDK